MEKREYPRYLLVHQNNLEMLCLPQKYISKSTLSLSGSNAAIESNRKLLSASMIQLHNTVLFSNTYG